MKLKTFTGKTMAETLEQVKRQFGRSAVILSTRTVTKGGILGLGGSPYIEITAAKQLSDLPAPLRRGTLQTRLDHSERAEGAATPVSLAVKPATGHPPDTVLSELGALKTLVQDLVRETRRSQTSNLPGGLHETYLKLVENAVAEEIARQIVDRIRGELSADQLRDPQVVRAHLARQVESMLPTAGPIRLAQTGKPMMIALVGPTGVGKTTTVAKLAANFCLREKRKVGLITIDTYRIAAVEQLKTYAQIIDVPLEVAMSADQLEQAVARMADRDVIFIDTAGRSQRDHAKIKELAVFFEVVRPDEVHLVLAGTCGETVLLETIERFSGLGIDRVIFTKLDEAVGFGVMLACLQKAGARLSYVTTGQDVPDDIHVGEGKALAKLILGTRSRRAECVASADAK
jgi:flagellar biosynthesis protein FlhF